MQRTRSHLARAGRNVSGIMVASPISPAAATAARKNEYRTVAGLDDDRPAARGRRARRRERNSVHPAPARRCLSWQWPKLARVVPTVSQLPVTGQAPACEKK